MNMDMQIQVDVKPCVNDIPTPPYSPESEHHAPQNNTSLVLLTELQSFYQSRSVWVHRTRAALELALDSQSRGALPALAHKALPAPRALQPTPPSSDVSDDEMPVKREPTTPPPLDATNPRSKWLQRKKSFKLKLELQSIRPMHLSHRKRSSQRNADAPPVHEPNTLLLDLFGQLMEARMESCNRVTRLVRESNRSDLC